MSKQFLKKYEREDREDKPKKKKYDPKQDPSRKNKKYYEMEYYNKKLN